MVTLSVWYDRTPRAENGDVTITVASASELDELVDRIQAETAQHVAPPMIQVAVTGTKRGPMLEVGIGVQKGFIGYTGPDEGGWTAGDGDPAAVADYVYMGNHTQVPAQAEVPMAMVRRGLHDFLTTGGRCPTVVQRA
ncbi:MAG TPA: Imm1 family immunity protein [Actinokineospora sp.]|jgi:hypothetical protein|nr:Imm1 family immunity protein [Actinokineospora sp.]